LPRCGYLPSFRFPIPAITNFGNSGNLPAPPPVGPTMIPKDLFHSTPEIPRQIATKSRRTGLKSRKIRFSFVLHWLKIAVCLI
jgi:hypothetical protein